MSTKRYVDTYYAIDAMGLASSEVLICCHVAKSKACAVRAVQGTSTAPEHQEPSEKARFH